MDNRPIKFNKSGKYNLDFIDWNNEWERVGEVACKIENGETGGWGRQEVQSYWQYCSFKEKEIKYIEEKGIENLDELNTFGTPDEEMIQKIKSCCT